VPDDQAHAADGHRGRGALTPVNGRAVPRRATVAYTGPDAARAAAATGEWDRDAVGSGARGYRDGRCPREAAHVLECTVRGARREAWEME
jgi:hypothetical protein